VPLGEFELIERYFRDCGAERADVRLGVGDDAALLVPEPGTELVAAIDTLVEGRHFPAGSPAASIGHRALAVNLSDVAAMGAQPAWALLAITLPRLDERWLASFAQAFADLAREHQVALVGGNTTAGPLCVSVQILGHVPAGRALLRATGRPGDILFVSGTPGDAAAGLAIELGKLQPRDPVASAYLRDRFLFPAPRVALGLRLREFASACIDVSDGLFGDAGKLAEASGAGLEIELRALPVSAELLATVGEEGARHLALTGGEDYELCFSVPAGRVPEMERALPPDRWGYCRIGALRATAERVVTMDGTVMKFSHCGFDHFAG
jgi:thiamine-monophosphate kinase